MVTRPGGDASKQMITNGICFKFERIGEPGIQG